ncbi:MAG: DNA mismatch repair protein MutS [Clostridium sp.]|uniref:MutS-related protein n=1 Tax=Clostridium sp. TaxID=1506 RepID=UPI00303C85F7
MIEDKFINIIEKHKKEISNYRKIYDKIGYFRLISMIGGIYCTYKWIRGESQGGHFYIALLFYIIFIGLLIYHKSVKEKLKFSEDMIEINNRYLDRISGTWVNFKDIGEEFIDKSHRYSYDLDIVGKESLFQLINITSTWKGRTKLAKDLLFPNYDEAEIVLRQEAVEELFNNIDLCENMEYVGKSKTGKLNDPEKLLNYVNDDSLIIKSKGIKGFIYIMPMVTIPLSLVIFLFKLSNIRWLISFFLVMQLIIWSLSLLKVNRTLESINYFRGTLEEYTNILKIIEKQEFKSQKLKDIKNRLFNEEKSSLNAIKELYSISERSNIKVGNGLLYIALNILFLWDYQCVFSLEAWKSKYGNKIENWLSDIGEIEGLMSLSVIEHINEVTCYPKVSSKELKIVSKTLGHPLISRDVRVCNDVSMEDNIFIITGSNMSGKTTFLRTMGVNLVLAYMGGPICGEELECAQLEIFTSMRITDDLKNGISTFYGELIRIKDIIEGSKNNKNMIFLIDEIFRGTNSKDRITGAEAVVRNLSNAGAMGALTTHDLELCNIKDNDRIKNYHFTEYYKDNKILFDYKIRDGKSNTTNARYLMKIVGIEV